MQIKPFRHSLRTSRIVIMVVLAIFCRSLWAADQSIHSATPSVDLKEFVETHGHAHGDVLGHEHDVSDPLFSEASHLLIHFLGVMDSLVIPCQPTHAVRSDIFPPEFSFTPPANPVPFPLFRPPRTLV